MAVSDALTDESLLSDGTFINMYVNSGATHTYFVPDFTPELLQALHDV